MLEDTPDNFKAAAIAALKACGATEAEIKNNWIYLAHTIHEDAVALLAGYRVARNKGQKANPRDVDSDD